MFHFFLRYIKGYVRLRVRGGFIEQFLNALGQRNMNVTDIHIDGDDYIMKMSMKDFLKIKNIVKRSKIKVKIEEKSGLPFRIIKYKKRVFIWAGFPLFIIIIFVLSRIVWDIDISGNRKYSRETIIQYLKTKNVKKGMMVDQVDCQALAKEIRRDFSDVIWVTVYIKGTKCYINLKENQHTEENRQAEIPEFQASNIVSDIDCQIHRMIVRSGVSDFVSGDRVKQGDIIVSGTIPILDDGGNIVDYHYVLSDADIFGEVEITYRKSLDLFCNEKTYLKSRRHVIYLKSHGYQWTIGIKKCRKTPFETYTSERKSRILDHLGIDLYWGIKEKIPYSIKKRPYDSKEIQKILSEEFELFLNDLKKKNVVILQNDVKIYKGTTRAWAYGKIKCICPVGKQIGIQTTGDSR